jgi:hypothetical protein
MTSFSPSDAALEGFRLTRENPKAFAFWALIAFVVSTLGALVSISMPVEAQQALATLNAEETPDAQHLLEALIAVSPILLFGLATQCMMAAAVYRLIFRHDDPRFGFVRLGIDELRLMALTVIYLVMAMLLLVTLTLAGALVMAAVSSLGAGVAVALGAAVELFLIGVVLFVAVRMSLAPVITFAERRLALFESWHLTRGHFWRLLGAYAIAIASIVVIGLLLLFLFTAVAGVIIMATGGEFADMSTVFSPDSSSIGSYFKPALVAYMLVGSVFSALYYAVIAAPGAVVYEVLHGRGAPVPAPE